MQCNQFTPATTRRQMLQVSAFGFGQVVLSAMAGQNLWADAAVARSASTIVPTIHLPARAKRIIFLFMWGGPSHVDLFDPKPKLTEESGKPAPGSSGSGRRRNGQLLG